MAHIVVDVDPRDGYECEGMSARWGSVPPEVLDKVLDFAESLAGKPDTIA